MCLKYEIKLHLKIELLHKYYNGFIYINIYYIYYCIYILKGCSHCSPSTKEVLRKGAACESLSFKAKGALSVWSDPGPLHRYSP